MTIVLALVLPALAADPSADVRSVSEAFARAVNAGDVDGVLALYADDAIVIWPGAGQEARGEPEIERLVRGLLAGGRHPMLMPKSLTAIPLDADHVADVGLWENVITAPDGRRMTTPVRTVEILVRRNGKWLYLVDHASIGVPPPAKPSRRGARRERGER